MNTLTLTVSYDPAQLRPAIDSSLAPYRWNGTQWVKEPGRRPSTT